MASMSNTAINGIGLQCAREYSPALPRQRMTMAIQPTPATVDENA
jgi:hypothetical protein